MNYFMILILLLAGLGLWFIFSSTNGPCSICEVIEPGKECWECGTVKSTKDAK